MERYVLCVFLVIGVWCDMKFSTISSLKKEGSFRINSCVCVPFYQCDSNGYIITDGSGLIDPRINKPESIQVDPLCEIDLHICCLLSKPTEETITQSLFGTTTTEPPLPIDDATKLQSRQCGTKKTSIIPFDSRILVSRRDGTTQFGEYPWQVAILRLKDHNRFFAGAGVLIDERHILTVAHKVYNVEKRAMLVRIGAWNLSADVQPLTYQEFQVKDVFFHPYFNNKTLKNDIAVIVLDGLVSLSFQAESICLPKIDENHDEQRCTVTGWGKDSFDGGKHSDVLKQVSVPMVSFRKCQDALRRTRLGSFFVLDESFICAGGEQGQDSCLGDGGGPLFCLRDDGTYSLMGLVAWGINCGQEGVPGVYVNVVWFLDWITSVTGKDLSFYWPSSSDYQS